MTTLKKAAKKAPKKTTATEAKAKNSTAAEPKPKKSTKAKKASSVETDSAEAILQVVAEAVLVAEVEEAVASEAAEETAIEVKTEAGAEDSPESGEEPEEAADNEPESAPIPRPPAKLERLQKILAAAGVASRRSAESMIEQGRVQVNGKVVTELGTKADAGRDHIRVDGKLLQGAERLRYFILNKPRGFVTTVKDPEGRPTVMQFFEKMKERLYPVGRLDYLSEGLLVVTNDGELANKLTKASSGVEKTYLVKVAGQPTEAELDILRGGVSIALGKPGSRTVRTSPARIRQVRQGDNPWYEVVLIEGRNRELRKMFEEIGHFVEKIRRTGYGPLVLDQEPGNLRELQPDELEALRKAAEGNLRTPKSKDLRRRNLLDAGLLPTVLPKPSSRPRTAPPSALPPAADASRARTDWSRPGAFKPKKFGPGQSARPTQPADRFASGDANKFFRPARPSNEGLRPAAGRTSAPNPVRSFSRNEEERLPRSDNRSPESFGFNRSSGRSFDRPEARTESRSAARPSRNFDRPTGRPAWKKDERPTPPPARVAEGAEARPFASKPTWKKPERPGSFSRPERSDRPERPARPARPDFKRSAAPRRDLPARETRVFDEDLEPIRPPNLHIEEITGPDRAPAPRPSTPRSGFNRPATSRPGGTNRPGAPRSYSDRPTSSRPGSPRPYADRSTTSRPSAPRSYSERPASDRPRPSRPAPTHSSFDRSAPSGRPSSFRPRTDRPTGDRSGRPSFSRPEGGRPSFTSSGQPRPGGARPSSKPGKFAKPGGSSKPYQPRTEGASDYRPTKAKPYPSSTSRAERKAGSGWKPKPGSSAKPGYKGQPSGKRPGGKPAGKKRNY